MAALMSHPREKMRVPGRSVNCPRRGHHLTRGDDVAQGTCSINGCETSAYCRGWCRMHYVRWQRHGDPLVKLRDQREHAHCTIDGCEGSVVAWGLCDKHRMRKLRRGDPLTLDRLPRGSRHCEIEGCTNTTKVVKGLCRMHYTRLIRHGDPLVTETPGRGDPVAQRNRRLSLNKARHARERDAEVSDFTLSDWLIVLDKWDHRCAYCGNEGFMTREHVIPLVRGGNHTADNIVPACKRCNSRKGSMTADEFLARSV